MTARGSEEAKGAFISHPMRMDGSASRTTLGRKRRLAGHATALTFPFPTPQQYSSAKMDKEG
jgi:hypothetical protein